MKKALLVSILLLACSGARAQVSSPDPSEKRIKTLEERNRELTELLERAYGVIAQT